MVDSAANLQETYHNGETITLTALSEGADRHTPTHEKLDEHWTGLIVIQQKDTTSVKVKMGMKEQVVHINLIRPLLQKDNLEERSQTWAPPLFQHLESGEADDCHSDNQKTRNSTPSDCVVRPPTLVAVLRTEHLF